MAKRVTQAPTEVLYQPATPQGRVTQTPVEALYLPASPRGRITQGVVEVLYAEGAPPPSGATRFWAQVIG